MRPPEDGMVRGGRTDLVDTHHKLWQVIRQKTYICMRFQCFKWVNVYGRGSWAENAEGLKSYAEDVMVSVIVYIN